jgi:drug/metabolite transporter (DMT)-like permease
LLAFALLALANLLWAGNWVTGRALREAFDPITLNFWRWLIAALVLAPFAIHEIARKRDTIRRHAGLLALLAFTGVAVFQSLVYLGLRTTTTINAVLLNSSAPLFMLLCSWIIERESATRRQVAGMLVSSSSLRASSSSCCSSNSTRAMGGSCLPCRRGESTRCCSSAARLSWAA